MAATSEQTDISELLENHAMVAAAVNMFYNSRFWPRQLFDIDDALQSCWVKLLEVHDQFDPKRGMLSTWVYNVVWRHLYRESENMGLSSRVRARYEFRRKMVSLDRLMMGKHENGKTNAIAEPEKEPPTDTTPLTKMLAVCNEREQMILRERAKGKTLREIGKDLGLSKERVRQLEAKAIKKCRAVPIYL